MPGEALRRRKEAGRIGLLHLWVTIADAMGSDEFGVTGWSEGGPWALAAAAYVDPARLLRRDVAAEPDPRRLAVAVFHVRERRSDGAQGGITHCGSLYCGKSLTL